MFCKKCGRDLGDCEDVKFCPQCGELVTRLEQEFKETEPKETELEEKEPEGTESEETESGDKRQDTVKVSKRHGKVKMVLKVGVILAIIFLLMDTGTALKLMFSPNVEKIVWVPCWEMHAGVGRVWTTCYGLADYIFGDRVYNADGKRIRNLVGTTEEMYACFNEKEETLTWFDRQGKERESFHLDGFTLKELTFADYEKGIVGVKNRGYLNYHTNQFYDSVDKLSDGYMIVEKNGLYGYVDANGNERIAPRYEFAARFRNGWAKVKKSDGSLVFIDKNGTEVFGGNLADFSRGDYSEYSSFDYEKDEISYSDTRILMEDGIANREGTYIIQNDNLDIHMLSGSLIWVEDEYEIFILDSNGKEKYRFAKLSDNGNEYYGYYLKKNDFIIVEFENSGEGDDMYTIISPEGQVVASDIKADNYDDFAGVQVFSDNGKIAVIDNGTVIHTEISVEGRLRVRSTEYGVFIDTDYGESYLISHSGELIEKFEGVTSTYGSGYGMAVFTDNQWNQQLYDMGKGELLLPGKYQFIDIASSKLVGVKKCKLWCYVVVLK